MKILIINENKNNFIGGIETYTNTISNFFHSLGHQVYEYVVNANPVVTHSNFSLNEKIIQLNNVKSPTKTLSFFEKQKLFRSTSKKIQSIYKDYDLIICQTHNIKWSKEIYNSKKWLFIQHVNPDFYKQKYIAGPFLRPIIYLGMFLFGYRNPFNKFQNFIFYSKRDEDILNKKKKKSWTITLASQTENEIDKYNLVKYENRTNNIAYFGRLDQFQKNIKRIHKVSTKQNLKIDFYGPENLKLVKLLKDRYKGPLNPKDVLPKMSSYKFVIALSKFEGFSFTIVESLSSSTPIIISDFCPSASWLVENKGFFVKNKKTEKQIKNFFNNITKEKYEQMQQNCYLFAKNNLSIEKFYENWKNVLDYFEKNK